MNAENADKPPEEEENKDRAKEMETEKSKEFHEDMDLD